MKLHFSLAAAAALLCAAPITSAYDDADVVQEPNVVEIEQEDSFPNQALNYWSEIEKTEVLADIQGGKDKGGEDKGGDKEAKEPKDKKDKEANEPQDKKDKEPKDEDDEPPKGEPEPPAEKPKKDKKDKDVKEPKDEDDEPPKGEPEPPAEEPTKKPKPSPKPTKRVRSNPTRKPTRKPSGSRSSRLINQEWRTDECSGKDLSKRCQELNDTVCSQKRLKSDARAVCIKVGLLESEDFYSFDQEPNVVEIEQEDSFPNQALNYLSEIEKTEVLADSSKDDKNDKKSPSSKDDSKPAPKPTPKPKPSKDRDAPTPTRKPKPTPKPTKRVRSNPTRKPTRKPSGSRSSSSLIRQNWSRDECSSRNLSKRCKELNDTVCSQNRRSLSSDARAVCIRVGLLKSEDLYSFDQEPNVVEIEQEDSIPNQALNYWSEIEKTEVLADIQGDKDKGGNDKGDKEAKEPKDKKDKDVKEPKDEPEPPAEKPEKPTKPKPTPKPTKKLRSNPTRKPTRKPSGSRSSSSLIKQNWSKGECSGKDLSKRCRELNDTVCSQKRSSLSSDEREVCIKVGLLKSENLYSEDAEFDNEFQYVADEE